MWSKFQPRFETLLILVGMVILCLSEHRVDGDGAYRYQGVLQLIEFANIMSLPYSFVGPVFSAPLMKFDQWFTISWFSRRYNFFIFILGIFFLYRLLRGHVEAQVLRRFFIILMFGSMFPHHQGRFYGEVFTAVWVAVGIMAVSLPRSKWRSFWGWTGILLGVANTAATIIGMGLLVLHKVLLDKRLRYFIPLVLALGLIVLEAWFRHGEWFVSGYENDRGTLTVMPYSGKPGFSYPFGLGVLSILLSFGKGILFYAPGLLLCFHKSLRNLDEAVRLGLLRWWLFLGGMVLIYAQWWSWYGGFFWGPRFFLFTAFPASFALAMVLVNPPRAFWGNVGVLALLLLSFWVGFNGIAYDQDELDICSLHNFQLEMLCWYTPEFSALFRPFTVREPLDTYSIVMLIYSGIAFCYLSLPLWQQMWTVFHHRLQHWKTQYGNLKEWRL